MCDGQSEAVHFSEQDVFWDLACREQRVDVTKNTARHISGACLCTFWFPDIFASLLKGQYDHNKRLLT